MAAAAPLPAPIPCEHKTEVGCVLTALPVCCACADKRPAAPAYPVYVDGEGMKMQGNRWARYCWKCRGSTVSGASTTAMPPPGLSHPGQHQLNAGAAPFSASNSASSATHHEPLPRQQGRRSLSPRSRGGQTIPIAQRATSAYSSYGQPAPPPGTSQPRQGRSQVFPLGTREDVERDDYVSPVTMMFSRAQDRYHTAEETRQQASAAFDVPAHAIRTMDISQQPAGMLSSQPHTTQNPSYVGIGGPTYPGTTIQLGFPTSVVPTVAGETPPLDRNDATTAVPAAAGGRPPFDWSITANDTHYWRNIPSSESSTITFMNLRRAVEDSSSDNTDSDNAIDRQTNRPGPLDPEQLVTNMACKMCLEQKIDTLIGPCMHLAMCRWCSDVWQENTRRLRRRDPSSQSPWKCPVCRRGIQQVRRVYF